MDGGGDSTYCLSLIQIPQPHEIKGNSLSRFFLEKKNKKNCITGTADGHCADDFYDRGPDPAGGASAGGEAGAFQHRHGVHRLCHRPGGGRGAAGLPLALLHI